MTWATKDSNGEYKIFTGNDFDSIGDKKLYKVMNPEQYKAAVAANEESVKTGIIGVADAKATSLGTSLAGLYVVTGSGECRPLSEADCKKDANGNYYLLDSSLVVKKQDNNGTVYKDTETRTGKTVTSADGKKTGTTLSIEQAKHDYGEKFETALQALKHRYESSGKSEEEIEALFTVVNYGDGTFAFVMTSDYDDNSPDVMVYEVTEGTYDKKMEDGTYKIERDTSGNINKIVMSDGAASSLNLTDSYNEFEYEAAVASYNAKKAEYDQEQNRLNKQTSIYQRQDKMLELKLTRLDNERNALNTEIEAVKKVIQDAIDRGFKTFSG